ncbi:MAG: hypothetical protein J6J25_04895 [Bacteroidales bacterium]|nr:hypothetical protein [Bacteroidales bacterium]
MKLLCLILLMTAVVLWFYHYEFDRFFGVYYPTCAVRRSRFPYLFLTAVVCGVILDFYLGADSLAAGSHDANVDCRSLIIILLSSFMVLGGMRLFSLRGSVVYATLGSLAAFFLWTGTDSFNWLHLLSIVAAPVVALALGFFLRLLQRAIIDRYSIHLITLSHYMRLAVILGVVLAAFALGLNWGGFLLGLGGLLEGVGTYTVLAVVLAGIILFLPLAATTRNSDAEEPSGMFADFSIYAVISVGFSVALTLLFFSLESTTSLVGLVPVPLSVSALMIAAVAGTELAQKSRLVDDDQYWMESASFILAPVASFFVTYILLFVIDIDEQDQLDDFAVMAVAAAAIAAMFFLGYIRRQRSQREATDRLVYTQQQQIYEHSRALNDMELKVVLSENQALHNAVEMKRQEVMNVALSIVEQRDYLESLSEMAEKLAKTDDPTEKDRLIAEIRSSLRQRLSHDREVDSQYFYSQAESLHEDFNAKLAENFPDLTQQERRLAALLRLGFSSKYIATLMNITPKSVEISRYRLRQKLGLSKGTNLVNFIKSI